MAAAGAIGVLALTVAVACTADDEDEPTPTAAPATDTPAPTPTATPTPEPTPTPTPEPTPTATPTPDPTPTPTSEPAPAPSMRDFRLTPETTGGDLLDALSEEENACIKAGVGDAIYGFLRGAPLLAAMASGGDSSAAAPFFACLSVENTVYLGFAMFDLEGGFGDEASRECFVDLALDQPAIILSRLGLERDLPAPTPDDIKAFVVGAYECWTDQERVGYLVGMLDQLAEANPYLGSNLVALLPASEVACVQEQLGEAEYGAFLDSNLTRGFGDELHQCFSDESHSAMFIAMAQVRFTGALSDDTVSCILDLTTEHPHFVEISTTLDPASLTPAEFAEVGRDGLLMLECMTGDELTRIQNIGALGLAAQ